jgi:hypothetical protein
LRLPAWAAQVKHEVASDLQRQPRAMVFFYQSQCQIHPRRNSSRGIHHAITDKYWVGINLGPRIFPGEQRTPIPVRCGTATVKDAGSTEEQCAGTDRANSPDTSSYLSEPSNYFNWYLIFLDGGATGYEQGVYLAPYLSKGFVRCDSQSTVRHNCRARCGGHDFDCIDGKSARILSAEHFGSSSKDLKWPDEIEDLSSRPRDEHNPARSRMTCHTRVI